MIPGDSGHFSKWCKIKYIEEWKVYAITQKQCLILITAVYGLIFTEQHMQRFYHHSKKT